MADPVADLTGTTVGRFRVRVRLGAGGMGEVYRADDPKLKRSVALKRMAPHLRADARYRQRFLKEAQRASGLTDQHIAGLYDVLEEGGETFLVMEYVEGETLRQRLQRPLSIDEFLALAAQCGEALVAAHRAGLVHRDLKPENIMLTPAGQVKVLDFGVAKRLPRPEETAATESVEPTAGGLSGTPAYMAPETLLEKESDGRADIFSLGVVFYEALTGRHPFLAASFVATSDRILREPPAPLRELNPRVPAELERIVAKMLAKRPEERYQTAADLLVDLRALERGAPPAGLRIAPARARRGLLPAAALALLVLAALLVPAVREQLLCAVGRCPVPAEKQLAILPFTNIGDDPANQVFCNGLTFTLTSKLAQLEQFHGSLLVISATEVVDKNVRTAEGARKEFGVNLVLTGSVQRAGERVLLTASLVDARTRKTLRSLSFDAQTDDSVALQEGVARRVAELLELELLPQEEPVLALGGTVVPGAYELYLGGWGYLQNYHKPDNLDRAVSLFQQALELDPDFALAHAGLGEAYWKKYEATKNKQWVEEARHACEHALTLEQRLAAAHTCLGTLYIGTGEYEKATSKFQHALERDPGSDDAWRGLARAYEARGRLEQAEATFQKAIALRPSYWGTHQNLGRFYYRQGRYSKAAPEFQRVIELAPDNVRGYYSLGALYHLMGRTDEAIALLERSLALEPTGDAYSNLGTFYFFQGRYAKAVSMFEKAAELAPNNYVVLGNLADAYRWAPGQAGKAAPAYQRAIELAQEQLQVNPRDASIPSDLAVYWAKLGETEKALSAIAVARSQAPGDVNILFKSVVVYHLAGQRERAVHALVESVRTGYSLAEIRADPELADLRRDPRYQQAVARESTGG